MTKPLLLLLLFAATMLLTCVGLALSLCNRTCDPCGSAEVPYPLSTKADCGNSSYPIICKNKKLYFKSTNNTYLITSITPSQQRLTIKPSSLIGGTCNASDLPQNGLQLDAAGLFNITGSNTIFYANCNESILQSPLNCSSNNLCHAYINANISDSAPCANKTCCTFKAGGSTTAYRIRLAESRCRAYMSFVDLDPNLPVKNWTLVKAGVELEWVSPTNSTCDGSNSGGV